MTCSVNLPSGYKSIKRPNFHFIRGTRRAIDEIALAIIDTSENMPRWRKYSFGREYLFLICEWFISGMNTDQIAEQLRRGNDFKIQTKEVLKLISDIEAAITLELNKMYKTLLSIEIEKEPVNELIVH